MKKNKTIIILCFLLITNNVVVLSQDLMADNMLLFQRNIGGWPKHYAEKTIDYNRIYSEQEKAGIKDNYNRNDATIDNKATTKEIRYLLKSYKKINNKAYLLAAERGIKYLLIAQYKNGGWPQFYPDLSSYRHQITFNDDAMINVLNVLYDLCKKINDFEVVEPSLIAKSEKAIVLGVDCILKTQVKVNNILTVWCAQYDEKTLKPDNARKFELISLSGNESVAIVRFLMRIEKPTQEIKSAINAAISWFKKSKIVGFKYVDIEDTNIPGARDRVILPDSSSIIWARFYDIETNKPFFCGRDGIKKWNLVEIELERRIGYAWYGYWPKQLLEIDYVEWKKRMDKCI